MTTITTLFSLLMTLLLLSDISALKLYDTLGITKTATTQEVKKAYKKLALKWHPDKNLENKQECETKFTEIAEAYSVLSDPAKRKNYDWQGDVDENSPSRYGEYHRYRGGQPFNFNMANDLFQKSFGDRLWREWRPGMTVKGVEIIDGKKKSITIHPNGTSEEKEADAGRQGGYQYVSRSGLDGASYELHISQGLGALAQSLLPEMLSDIPLLGPLLLTAIGWLPTVSFLLCCWRCCCGKRGRRSFKKTT